MTKIEATRGSNSKCTDSSPIFRARDFVNGLFSVRCYTTDTTFTDSLQLSTFSISINTDVIVAYRRIRRLQHKSQLVNNWFPAKSAAQSLHPAQRKAIKKTHASLYFKLAWKLDFLLLKFFCKQQLKVLFPPYLRVAKCSRARKELQKVSLYAVHYRPMLYTLPLKLTVVKASLNDAQTTS